MEELMAWKCRFRCSVLSRELKFKNVLALLDLCSTLQSQLKVQEPFFFVFLNKNNNRTTITYFIGTIRQSNVKTKPFKD